VAHARGFAVVAAPGRALDLGSGGGVPGLVLAVHWPKSSRVLHDAQSRRGAFLTDAAATLGLAERVRVVVDRAERAAHASDLRGAFDLVVARSFGPPAVTAECAVGFLRDGGDFVVSEPPDDEPTRWPADGLAGLGFEDRGRIGAVRRLTCIAAAGDAVPRREGAPSKHPLW
jgi:16S rRNA (guanine527-N7)-methyltransferase